MLIKVDELLEVSSDKEKCYDKNGDDCRFNVDSHCVLFNEIVLSDKCDKCKKLCNESENR